MSSAPKMKLFSLSQFDKIPQIQGLSEEDRFNMKVVSHVLPFRVNNYVLENLIDGSRIPNDPMFQLTFMQKEMLKAEHFEKMAAALKGKLDRKKIQETANEIRKKLNPHPAGQITANVPTMNEEVVPGIQHKYKETCLVFPAGGQTCFSYCTFCFRWPQFVGMEDLRFVTDESQRFLDYIREHKELTDVLITGGDPMIMSASKMKVYLEPLLGPGFEHIQNIRIGTKFLGYWPYRLTSDRDADDYLRLFEKLNQNAKCVSIMAHFNHPVEVEQPAAEAAVKRLRSVGCQIRTQSPLLRRINDDADIWSEMWKAQVRQGMLPYYFFVERDTGPRQYFEVPLSKALHIYREALQKTSGLARTVRGPSMSCYPGKVCVEGISEINGEKVFVLSFLQGRNSDWIKRPFFAKYDSKARWIDDLQPAFGEKEFFYERELRLAPNHAWKGSHEKKLRIA